MTIIITILILINIYIFVSLKKEQEYRRAIEMILSGLVSFSTNEENEKDRVSTYRKLILHVKYAIDHAYGGFGFYKLNKNKFLFSEVVCDEVTLNNIYKEAVEQGVAEMRQIEREQNEKNKTI